MASVFWKAHAILFIDLNIKGLTINRDHFVAQLGVEKQEVSKYYMTLSQVNKNDGKIHFRNHRIR